MCVWTQTFWGQSQGFRLYEDNAQPVFFPPDELTPAANWGQKVAITGRLGGTGSPQWLGILYRYSRSGRHFFRSKIGSTSSGGSRTPAERQQKVVHRWANHAKMYFREKIRFSRPDIPAGCTRSCKQLLPLTLTGDDSARTTSTVKSSMPERSPSQAKEPMSDRGRVRRDEATEGKPDYELVPDCELLELYVEVDDQAALATIVERYAGLVATVCRMAVSDSAAAEDAFQATFLVLMRSAKKIRARQSLPAWLHGVAYRTASRIRKQIHSSRLSNEPIEGAMATTQEPIETLARQAELETLNRELDRLPDTYRNLLVEHYLLGKTATSIADSLDLTTSAVEGRLRRGRRLLRRRLASRGIAMSIVVGSSGFLQDQLLAGECGQWAADFNSHYVTPSGNEAAPASSSPTSEVLSLVNKETAMFGTSAIKVAATLVLAISGGSLLALWENDGQGGAGGSQKTVLAAGAQTADQSTTPNQISAPSTNPVLGQAAGADGDGAQGTSVGGMGGGMGGGAGGMGGAVGGMGGMALAGPPAEWARPTDENGSSQLPGWLATGEDVQKKIERNRMQLSQEVEVAAIGAPLSQVAEQLSSQVEIPIRIKSDELEGFGIDVDTPVNFEGRMSLREAFRIMLNPLELTYQVRESGLEITTIEDADAHPTTRFYDLSYILPNSANATALINAIQVSIDSDGWDLQGGSSSIVMVGSMMIVSTTEETHEKIQSFLNNFRRMNPNNASPDARVPAMGGMGGLGGMGGGMGGMGGGMGGMGGGMF